VRGVRKTTDGKGVFDKGLERERLKGSLEICEERVWREIEREGRRERGRETEEGL
jgi:hypothetical protein